MKTKLKLKRQFTNAAFVLAFSCIGFSAGAKDAKMSSIGESSGGVTGEMIRATVRNSEAKKSAAVSWFSGSRT